MTRIGLQLILLHGYNQLYISFDCIIKLCLIDEFDLMFSCFNISEIDVCNSFKFSGINDLCRLIYN